MNQHVILSDNYALLQYFCHDAAGANKSPAFPILVRTNRSSGDTRLLPLGMTKGEEPYATVNEPV